MDSVQDWAELRRLHDVEGMSKAAIAAKLSRSTRARSAGQLQRRQPVAVAEGEDAVAADAPPVDAGPRVCAAGVVAAAACRGPSGRPRGPARSRHASVALLASRPSAMKPQPVALRLLERMAGRPGANRWSCGREINKSCHASGFLLRCPWCRLSGRATCSGWCRLVLARPVPEPIGEGSPGGFAPARVSGSVSADTHCSPSARTKLQVNGCAARDSNPEPAD